MDPLNNSPEQNSSNVLISFHPGMIGILQKTLPENTSIDAEENSTLIGIYSTLYHSAGESYQFFRLLRYFPNVRNVEIVFDVISCWEIRRANHPSRQKAIECMLRHVDHDIEMKHWILTMLDRGIFYKMKRYLLSKLPKLVTDYGSLAFSFVTCILSIGCFFWDIVKDLVTFGILDHISTNILVILYLTFELIKLP